MNDHMMSVPNLNVCGAREITTEEYLDSIPDDYLMKRATQKKYDWFYATKQFIREGHRCEKCGAIINEYYLGHAILVDDYGEFLCGDCMAEFAEEDIDGFLASLTSDIKCPDSDNYYDPEDRGL